MGRAARGLRGGAREAPRAQTAPDLRQSDFEAAAKAMRRRALAVWALGACVDAQCAETCQTCKSASSTDCETCRDGYVLIDGDLDGVGACEPLSVDWDFNAGACRSSLSDHVGMASDLEGCWVLCSELYGANLKAIDLDSNNWCTCQDACECMDPGNGGGYYVMTSLEFANGLPAACETDETPLVCEGTCPDGSSPECCDIDGDCEDGDDDWCCGDDYLCSNDSSEWAASRGGKLCCVLDTIKWGATGTWCKSELDHLVGLAATLEDCWTFCVEAHPDVLEAVDLNDRGECFCQDACTCLDDQEGLEGQLMTAASISALPDACNTHLPADVIDADDGDDKKTRRAVQVLVFAMAATVVVCCCFAAAVLAAAARVVYRRDLRKPRAEAAPRATAVEWPSVPHEAVVVL